MTLTVRWRNDRNILNNLAKKLTGQTEKAVQDAAQQIGNYIQNNWSEVTPSSPFTPPSVVSSQLEQSMKIESTSSGIISSAQISFYAVNDDGEDYSKFLEQGTMKMSPRPYIAPAVEFGKTILRSAIEMEMSI